MTYKAIPLQSFTSLDYMWDVCLTVNGKGTMFLSVDEAEQLANDMLDLVKRIKTASDISPEED